MNRPAEQAEDVLNSGLFDRDFYLRQNRDLRERGLDPGMHYSAIGMREGRRPNLFFEPAWYARKYLSGEGVDQAVVHYLTRGERQGCNPSPFFDAAWYAQQYGIDLDAKCALAHYLSVQLEHRHAPNRHFDTADYVSSNPDILKYKVNAFIHYLRVGVFEGRICRSFNAEYMWRTYLGNDRSKNPIQAFYEIGVDAGWRTVPDPDRPSIAREIRRFSNPGPLFEDAADPVAPGTALRGKVVAFYLPQYHAIPENDAWWGTGFTEWRNIPRGVPRFAGHYQPRIPRDLGFYDLTDPGIMRRQVALAKRAGIHGFCFYYYNFDGKRLLERPVDAYLDDPTLDFPFCLIWANENWTRRWDGMEQEVLLRQGYDPAQARAFVADVARHMADPRYMRCDGRPLLFLYRSDIVPNCAENVKLWRRWFREDHGLDPIIAMAQTFNNNDPRPYGFDGALEFPPHKLSLDIELINATVDVLDDDFEGQVRTYDDFVSASARAGGGREYPLIKTALPGWDNDARRQGKGGGIIHESSPQKFGAWVETLLKHAQAQPFFGEPLVFVNAWNEWGEGAYLEPDVHYGYAYLNALAQAVAGARARRAPKILLVGHDAFPAGSQYILLNLGQLLVHRFGYEVACILVGGGDLADDFKALGRTLVGAESSDVASDLSRFVADLKAAGYGFAITNTVFSGAIAKYLKDHSFSVCSLIHELPTVIESNHGRTQYELICASSDVVVYPNAYVRDELDRAFPAAAHRAVIRHQGLYNTPTAVRDDREQIRHQLGIPAHAPVVINVGYGDVRKGIDFFVELAARMAAHGVHFIWVGDVHPQVSPWLLRDIERRRLDNVHLAGFTKDIGSYLAAADLFFLSSREDPFPSVVLEALASGLPVVAFDWGSGIKDLLRSDPLLGVTTPYLDQGEAERTVLRTLNDPHLRSEPARTHRARTIEKGYRFDKYAFDVAAIMGRVWKISVVVPNYNYKRYLEGRLRSVFEQSYPVFEVIVLDDCSTDGSPEEVERLAETLRRDFVYVENAQNSGSVFRQWQRACDMAQGDLVWIAEADDLAAPDFLRTLVRSFDNEDVLLAFCDSQAIDESGALLRPSYKDYYETLFPGALQSDLEINGAEFLRDYLSVRNPILNVSSVLWRRDVLATALARCGENLADYRLAGDWRLYIEACALPGLVGYKADALNIHRRHGDSVTHATDESAHLAEIEQIHRHLSRFALGPQLERAQRTYIESLRRQFGLVPAS
ncbi:glycoside hydrolase family 99-like domain-containing protein [Chelatococcus reniformis]|uniref:Glycosyltransferase 2-like domain-containing protein n=1 Tax=Chelatococcus reniformis TaxID=1494448 RepID=A0A916XFY3_9HYPH|nr:glycoside hydrolase family 99-like domain-containing protein [Chelatococcus reniformis]GGC67714.1 hypothetical protein GCM10010994_27900 [Chelatococcus reniformis]